MLPGFWEVFLPSNVCASVCVLCSKSLLPNMPILKLCKHSGPVWVRHSEYPLFLLLFLRELIPKALTTRYWYTGFHTDAAGLPDLQQFASVAGSDSCWPCPCQWPHLLHGWLHPAAVLNPLKAVTKPICSFHNSIWSNLFPQHNNPTNADDCKGRPQNTSDKVC